MEKRHAAFLRRCLSIDLEVNPKTAEIFAFAAVRLNDALPPQSGKKPTERDLDRLEAALVEVDFPIGHNFLRHDMEHLLAVRPWLAKALAAPIDTLWLNPLAFPRNPYHHLVKHYQDGRLQAGHVNDPVLDARLVFEVLANQFEAFERLGAEQPDALLAYHFLTTRFERAAGFDAVFACIRKAGIPQADAARAAIARLLDGQVCSTRLEEVLERLNSPRTGWPMAYALAWISVAGGDSVMPPWVRVQFPEAAGIVRELRDTPCKDPGCTWCSEKNDPLRALKRWFGFDAYRPQPVDTMGRPLQERIVAEAMSGRSLLGILPTGTGKSVCYQIPALSKFDKTGALSVVISPLVALMADQVQGMVRAGISSAVTVNGMLSMPERQEALERIRMGEAAILIISPEQLRSPSIRSILKQREVGLWVLDEAHCVSKWGHDFRPDYRYIGRFIREFSGDEPPAPVICLTATAKPEVVRDIREHFKARIGADLLLLDGGALRTNLNFEVLPTRQSSKLADILDVIAQKLPSEGVSGAVIYCATRKETERVADFLKQQKLSAAHYHAGLGPDEKKDIQEKFRIGELRVIAATNAFGMGIDKPDIRLVVHGDIPGSLENYLQEAGRAGRDRAPANCVLLFAAEDVERQFSLSARSRLARHEIGAILRALRRINERTRRTGMIVATPGEIVRAERDHDFVRDSATDDTRVKTAVSWLEEAALVSREENRVQVFPSSLLVRTIGEARELLAKADINDTRRQELLSIVGFLMNAPPDKGVSTDELCGACGLSPVAMNKAMADLETLGIARNDMAITVFIHIGGEAASQAQLGRAARLEMALIARMREAAPDMDNGEACPLSLPETCQALRDEGHDGARPDIVEKLLRSMSRDGRDPDGGLGNLRLRKASRNSLMVVLQRRWRVVDRSAELRHQAAGLLLEHLLGKLRQGVRGKDIQVETTVGNLLSALTGDALMRSSGVKDMTKLMERALLWLHEQGAVTLGKGLTVFRPAMTVHLNPEGGQFTVKDFLPLDEHYREQTTQTHVMAAYAEKGLETMEEAQRLSEDYFVMEQEHFLRRWLPDRGNEIRRQTTGRSWREIVEGLGNRVQEKIVSDDRERTNVLVLAGPGSGKTRVLVHRIAYLLRMKREDPQGILVLCYNRHAAAEIRVRLRHLVGDDAAGVTVSTCHALAMRLVGASFAGASSEMRDFDGIVLEAVRQLNGDGLSKEEAEAQRDALIQGYRWILVDEYQDIGPEEYALIAAVAGRSQEDPDLRLSLFAVGDDDQNIYAFAGASIGFIRRFEEDYRAKPGFLTENYRSTRHIVEAANEVIALAGDRMKAGHDISVNVGRQMEPAGGAMAGNDTVAQGRVQLLDCPAGDVAQAIAAVEELQRLSRLDPDWNWARTAVIAREWKRLAPVRAHAERLGIPVEMANEDLPNIWRLREMQALIAGLRRDPARMFGVADILSVLNEQPANRWVDLIAEGVADLAREIGTGRMAVPDLVERFAEWSRDTRGEQRGLLLLTGHRAKGLEFDHVVILNGGWDKLSTGEDGDAPRRLFYVGMTRARSTLAVMTSGEHRFVKAAENVLHRKISVDLTQHREPEKHYQMPDLKVVDLSYAGRLRERNETLAAIAGAKVGDSLRLVPEGRNWILRDRQGRILGRMAKSWFPPAGQRFLEGSVGAVVRWRKSDNEETYRSAIRREEWETVLPELVFVRRQESDFGAGGRA
ncbi:MAG: RecQ family ATP-dependent DNA helicase [Tropicimonas sp.]|uniref:RecQ family ATP-dependent DNA helicase n=1 Tax=Tropicimonas sp. TaxID=2067044 RepID=UPI003A85A4E7